MADREQILRFAVGSSTGPRSRTWRLWVPPRRSDVYLSVRRLGADFKVSIHEPGPARCALTRHWVARKGYVAPAGEDPRLAREWNRPRPRPPNLIARPFEIIVPWDEVREQRNPETGPVHWTAPPPEGACVHFDLVYTPSGADVGHGHPGARSMGTRLVGVVALENGEHVFVTSIVRPMEAELRARIERLRTLRIIGSDGKEEKRSAVLAFGTSPNPDAEDGTEVGTFLDVSRSD